MKKPLVLVMSILCLVIFTLGPKSLEVSAGYVGTTYDSYLKSDIPNDYYLDIDVSKPKDILLSDLEETISKNYVAYDYDTINDYMKETDPILGDASENNKYCRDLYTGKPVVQYNDYDAGDYPDGEPSKEHKYDREHVWPKSYGFPDYKNTDAGTDMHHIRPAMATINQTYHNNYFYGETDDCTDVKTLYGNSFGKYDGEFIFEPADEVKGDIARMMFYMDVRYHTASTNQLALSLVSRKTGYADTTNYDGECGDLDTLLQWNEEDPVSPIEIHRNEVVFSYQHNRNPFIDHPEYSDYIFSDAVVSLEDRFVSTSTLSKLEVSYTSIVNVSSGETESTVSTVNLENLTSNSEITDKVLPATFNTEESAKYYYAYSSGELSILGVKLGTAGTEGKLDLDFSESDDIYESFSVVLSPWQGSGKTDGAVTPTTAEVEVTDNSGNTISSTILLDSAENKTLDIDLNTTIKRISINGGSANRCFVHSYTLVNSGIKKSIDYYIENSKLFFGTNSLNKEMYNKSLSGEATFGILYGSSSFDTTTFTGNINDYLLSNNNLSNVSLSTSDMNLEGNLYSSFTSINFDKDFSNNNYLYSNDLYSSVYMEYEGNLYFMNIVTYSVNSIAKEYIDNYIDEEIVVTNLPLLEILSVISEN